MEAKRQLDVLDKKLSETPFVAGDEYTIADMPIFPWYGNLVKGKIYDAVEFLSLHEYKHIIRWADMLLQREGVLRGRLVNRTWGDSDQQLKERHSKTDFEQIDITFR
jgi:GSH-dependent disulfide-bond oxidoreductase